MRRGDLDAVRLLADVHADPAAFRWLGQLVTRDEQIVLLYAQLYLDSGGRRYRDRITRQSAEWAARMLPADAPMAQNQAKALADRYLGQSVNRNEMEYGATGSAERSGWFEGKPLGGKPKGSQTKGVRSSIVQCSLPMQIVSLAPSWF